MYSPKFHKLKTLSKLWELFKGLQPLKYLRIFPQKFQFDPNRIDWDISVETEESVM